MRIFVSENKTNKTLKLIIMLDFLKTLKSILLTDGLISETTEIDQIGVDTYRAGNITVEAFIKRDNASKFVISHRCI